MGGGGGGGQSQRGQLQYLGGGVLQNVHTCRHAHIHVARRYRLLKVHTPMHACKHMHEILLQVSEVNEKSFFVFFNLHTFILMHY